MIIVEWAPITETEWIPPFGYELEKHIAGYKNPSVRHASCSAWGLLYKTLVEHNLGHGTVVFEENGKPSFANHDIYFSLSHTKGLCAVAVADIPIGVDIEQCREKYNQHLIERSLSTAEKACFDGDFTHLWCRKEAIAKMTGQGIAGYPSNIDTTAYQFHEQQIEYAQTQYWLVAVTRRSKGIDNGALQSRPEAGKAL